MTLGWNTGCWLASSWYSAGQSRRGQNSRSENCERCESWWWPRGCCCWSDWAPPSGDVWLLPEQPARQQRSHTHTHTSTNSTYHRTHKQWR